MTKSDNQVLNEKLNNFEKRCDEFLATLQSMKILNLNLPTPQEAVIDVYSADWKIFHNDLLAMIERYKGDLGGQVGHRQQNPNRQS